MGSARRKVIASLVLALGSSPILPVAADGIRVIESAAVHSFAEQATFTLQARSDAEIAHVHLFLRATGETWTESVDVEVDPAREISTTYVHDLRTSPLPPFATVSFWWRIEDAAGKELTTTPQQFQYTDNRFEWKHLSGDRVTIHWIAEHGDLAFGQMALDIAQASLETIGTELGVPSPDPLAIYVYGAQRDLDAAMERAGRDWIEGQAYPESGVIIVLVPFKEGYASKMKRVIPHEITHVLVYQAVTGEGHEYVPEWLEEGLATANELSPNPDYAVAIEEARSGGRLLPIEDLCVPFPPDPNTAFLSYAQSGSLVGFMRDEYGAAGIRELLAAYAQGASCAGGVWEAFAIGLSDLEDRWRASLDPAEPAEPAGLLPAWLALPRAWLAKLPAWFVQVGPWVGLWLLSLLAAVPMVGALRRRR